MGRQTFEAQGAGRLNQAVGEAARILSGDLAACSRLLRAMLDTAIAEEVGDEKLAVIQGAVELAGAAAKLGEILCKLKSETRHRISVERTAESPANAPQTVPKTRPSRTRTTRKSAEISHSSGENKGGGGGPMP